MSTAQQTTVAQTTIDAEPAPAIHGVRGTLMVWAALLGRDLRAFLRSRSQFYSSVLLPLMLLAILGTGVSDGLDPTSPVIRDGDYVSYLAAGMIALTALFSSTFSSASFYRDRESGMLRTLLAAPHRAETILFGKALAAVTIGTVQALIVLAIAAAVPGIDLAWQYGWLGGLAMVVAGIVTLNILLTGMALVIATRIRTMQGFHLVMNLVLFPLFFLSGAFFPLDQLPDWLRILGLANPLTYPVDLIQTTAYAANNDGFVGPAIDFAVLGVLALSIFVLGLRRSSNSA